METCTARTISSSQHLEPRPHACHARTHRHTQPGAQTPPAAPPRPLREPPPALTAPRAARPGWREVVAQGRFDFPAARTPQSRSWSRGGGARSRIPSPAAARAETQQEAVSPGAPGSALRGSGSRRRPRPTGPLRPLPLLPRPKPHAPLHRSTRPSRRPRPAPLRLAPLRSSSSGTSPPSAGPPASSSPLPQPLLDPRPPLPPPPFPLSLPTPPLRAPLLSPPFAAQPRLRSWGRAQGVSCSREGVNRARVD